MDVMRWLAHKKGIPVSEVVEWPMQKFERELERSLFGMRIKFIEIENADQLEQHFGTPYDGLKKQ